MNINGLIGYEIFVESFYDSNNDGIGDLKGISLKLDYLKTLGVTLLWLTPFNSSPQVDNGYDVSDYYSVDKRYGTIDDLKELLDEAHKRGIKIIMDFVMNHTSDEHEWFELSRKRIEPYNDFYIWRDKPNNWIGFAGDAWKYDDVRKQYYFHIFNEHQPDLNYQNPMVLSSMLEVAEYYLKLGIDGFRLDAVSHLAKEKTFRNSLKCKKGEIDTNKYSNRKEVFEYLRPLKKLSEKYNAIIVGEVGGNAGTRLLKKFTNYKDGVMDIAFTFNQTWMNDMYGIEDASNIKGKMFTPKRFIHEYMNIYKALHKNSQMVNYWLNHDHPRLASHYGDENNPYSLSALAGLLYLLPGMPFIYYGEEIGMHNIEYTSIDEFHDAYAIEYLKEDDSLKRVKHLNRVNRDSSRGVMEWDSGKYLGFSDVVPFRSIGKGCHQVALKQFNDESSLFNFYRKIIEIRKSEEFYFINHPDKLIMKPVQDKGIYYKIVKGNKVLEVYVNLTDTYLQNLKIDKKNLLISNFSTFSGNLEPYQIVVFTNF